MSLAGLDELRPDQIEVTFAGGMERRFIPLDFRARWRDALLWYQRRDHPHHLDEPKRKRWWQR